jgi:hypothetical protein
LLRQFAIARVLIAHSYVLHKKSETPLKKKLIYVSMCLKRIKLITPNGLTIILFYLNYNSKATLPTVKLQKITF